ncbi:MAG: transcription antitermination factor NusB [Proteobacteria bacterium]|nr:transcription antitermination factor NusB [Pseudomonadota bacterium]
MSDRPKTMRERTTLKVVAGKITPARAGVSGGEAQEFDPSTVWTGTTLSTALANARAAEGVHAEGVSQGGVEPSAAHATGSAEAEGTRHGAHAHHEGPAKKIRAKPSSPSSAKPSSTSSRAKHAFAATRSVARKLALQALYRWQLNDSPWQDLVQEFGEAEDMANADREYFRELVEGVWAARESLDGSLAELMDRPVAQLDPVEHAVLLIGLFELTARPEVPYRVAINESVGLAKRFGATDGHKFVNAVLDRAARKLRPSEH